LRLASKRTAFSSKTHCVLHHFTLYLVANSPKTGAGGGAFKYKFILSHTQTNPFLHQNKPSRESIFCGKVGGWWIKKALIVLNLLLKTRQKQLCGVHVHGQRNGKRVRLQLTTQAVTGHTAHGQRKQHHGKAEVRWN